MNTISQETSYSYNELDEGRDFDLSGVVATKNTENPLNDSKEDKQDHKFGNNTIDEEYWDDILSSVDAPSPKEDKKPEKFGDNTLDEAYWDDVLSSVDAPIKRKTDSKDLKNLVKKRRFETEEPQMNTEINDSEENENQDVRKPLKKRKLVDMAMTIEDSLSHTNQMACEQRAESVVQPEVFTQYYKTIPENEVISTCTQMLKSFESSQQESLKDEIVNLENINRDNHTEEPFYISDESFQEETLQEALDLENINRDGHTEEAIYISDESSQETLDSEYNNRDGHTEEPIYISDESSQEEESLQDLLDSVYYIEDPDANKTNEIIDTYFNQGCIKMGVQEVSEMNFITYCNDDTIGISLQFISSTVYTMEKKISV